MNFMVDIPLRVRAMPTEHITLEIRVDAQPTSPSTGARRVRIQKGIPFNASGSNDLFGAALSAAKALNDLAAASSVLEGMGAMVGLGVDLVGIGQTGVLTLRSRPQGASVDVEVPFKSMLCFEPSELELARASRSYCASNSSSISCDTL